MDAPATSSAAQEPEEALLLEQGGTLRLKIYHPAALLYPDPVILIHGLLSSADAFDLPGAPHVSFARYLQGAGWRVITYDQRGAGGSTAEAWTFGLRELALEDLPAVVAYALRRFNAGRVRLGSQSFGGVQAYLLRAFLAARGGPWRGVAEGHLGDAFAIAAPARFSPARAPWREILRQGEPFIRGLDADGDGKITSEEYVHGQIRLFHPLLGAILRPGTIRRGTRFMAGHPFLAAFSGWLPSPVLVYNRRDFEPRVFPLVLKSRILNVGAPQVLFELEQAMHNDGVLTLEYGGCTVRLPDDLKTARPFRLLTISSARDRMVPAPDVAIVHGAVGGGEHLNTEEAFGIPCGHAGYLFKAGLYPQVYEAIRRFLSAECGVKTSDE
jgi:pimeloyl-ACP methyl ester carboxylesterase